MILALLLSLIFPPPPTFPSPIDDFVHQSLVRNAAARLFEEIDVDGNHVLDTGEFLGILRKKGFSISPLATAEILEAEAIACGIDTADDGKIIMNKVIGTSHSWLPRKWTVMALRPGFSCRGLAVTRLRPLYTVARTDICLLIAGAIHFICSEPRGGQASWREHLEEPHRSEVR